MAGTTKDMSLIKQVLQLKQTGEFNRGVSRKLPIDKETVNGYVNTVKANSWNISDLLEIDDPELERMFHAGAPAYTDRRMEEFLILLPRCKELLADSKSHVSRQVLFDSSRRLRKITVLLPSEAESRCEEGCYSRTCQHLQTGRETHGRLCR